ncbi:hypothetical protein F2Q68_00022009 [Brassica cretica]|uniref:Uncharacterized protein n=1 Tax=Brassica cretica TaxID=69181 RepID=A0A8S9FQF9_BRACR|nr:hypothetical protein F2Q68_00022009 [Brassica cretica]
MLDMRSELELWSFFATGRSVHNASLSLSLYVMNIDRLIVSGEPERDTVTWNFIFHEDEYMISEKELLVNRLRLL